MPEDPRTTPRRRPGPGAVAALMALSILLAGGSAPEDALVRRIKVDVFDQNWTDVLAGCDEVLSRFPGGSSAPLAAFYRARALSRLPGREREAPGSFREFIRRHPGETLLIEEAWSSLVALACPPRGADRPACAATLTEALASPHRDVATLAAIRAAGEPDEDLRRRALPVLKRAHASQADPDVRNEILIAILKIDPREVPAGRDASPAPSGRGGSSREPTLIRMTVFDKREGRFEVKVNVPVAFARLLIDALGEPRKADLRREAREQGVNLDDIFAAISKAGAGRLLTVDSEESRIEIWIE